MFTSLAYIYVICFLLQTSFYCSGIRPCCSITRFFYGFPGSTVNCIDLTKVVGRIGQFFPFVYAISSAIKPCSGDFMSSRAMMHNLWSAKVFCIARRQYIKPVRKIHFKKSIIKIYKNL